MAASLIVLGSQASAGIVSTVTMGTANQFSVLAGSTVTNSGPSSLNENLGLWPGTAVTGFPPGTVAFPAVTHVAPDGVALQAKSDLTAAYVDAANRPVEFTQANADLVGVTLAPGVYESTAHGPLGLTGQLVLDGQGNNNAVFIFQTDSTLTTGPGSTIELINGASECNVFWQVGSSATLATGSVFVGNILALTSITVNDSVTVHGRALARNGAVTLLNDTFTAPSCIPAAATAPPATTTTTPAPATTTAAATSTTAPFNVTDITLPSTGSGSGATGVLGAAAVVLGVVAVLAARRHLWSHGNTAREGHLQRGRQS
jgi:type VI secretion system secreted protein VgrG